MLLAYVGVDAKYNLVFYKSADNISKSLWHTLTLICAAGGIYDFQNFKQV